jgi:hypothetical protein
MFSNSGACSNSLYLLDLNNHLDESVRGHEMEARYIFKLIISAVIIVAVSEISKRSTAFAAIVASLPLTSILAMVLLYNDTSDGAKVAELSTGILGAIIPSLVLFIVLPILIKKGIAFYPSMALSCAATASAYFIYARFLVR